MYSYIFNLLSIKLEKHKKQNEEKKEKMMNFFYNKLDNENAFKKEIEKYTRKNLKRGRR